MFDKEFNIMKEAILYVGDNIFLKGASKKTSKGKADYFTDKDIACEKYIIDTIKSNFLNDNIISEETNSYNDLKNRSWIIDPIDGTLNYMNGLKECGIQVAFYANGECQFAIIYLPYFKELYFAKKGEGAFLNDKKLDISPVEIKDAMIDMDIHSTDLEIVKLQNNIIYKLVPDILKIRMFGAACYNFVVVATSKTSAHILVGKKLNVWDTMPGLFICKEAGANTVDIQYNGYNIVIAADTEMLIELIVKIIKEEIDKLISNN